MKNMIYLTILYGIVSHLFFDVLIHRAWAAKQKGTYMKAYQLKMIVKNTKPPVWIRMEVPAGMTFSALSLILNHVYLLEQKGTFGFEFYMKKVRLAEDGPDNLFKAKFDFDVQDAASTFIDTYLDTEKNFSYFSNDMKFRVEIEKTDSQYLLEFPSVIKFSGFSEEHPVVKKASEIITGLYQFRMEYQNEPVYDSRAVLTERVLEAGTRISGMKNPVNKPDNIKKSVDTKLRETAELITNAYMLKINDLKEEVEDYRNSGEEDPERLLEIEHRLKTIQQDMETSLKKEIQEYYHLQPEKQDRVMLKEVISLYTKSDLIEFAKDLHLRRYSSFSKVQIAEKIANTLLSPDVMRERMGLLEDSQMELFEKVLYAKYPVELTEEEREDAEILEETEYLYFTVSDRAAIPEDVKEKYRVISTPEFQKKRQEKVWLLKCVRMVYYLYGTAPLTIVRRLYRKKPGFSIDMERMKALLLEIPEEESFCSMVDGRIVDSNCVENKKYLKIEECQGDKAFYIPSPEEIEDYYKNGYPSQNPHYQALLQMLVKDMDVSVEEAENLVKTIFIKIAFGYDFSDVMDEFKERGIFFSNEDMLRKGVDLLTQVNNHTRKIFNRGYMPDELFPAARSVVRSSGKMPTIVPGSTHAADIPGNGEGKIREIRVTEVPIGFGSSGWEVPTGVQAQRGKNAEQTKKIYPNDPCPCGSGKKFKKCCGRN